MKIGDIVRRPNSLRETVYTVVEMKKRGKGYQVGVQRGRHPQPTIRTQVFPKSKLILFELCSKEKSEEIAALFANKSKSLK